MNVAYRLLPPLIARRIGEELALGHCDGERADLQDDVDGLPHHARGKLLTHMPLAPESSYTHIIGALKEAYELSSQMEEPDLELDLEGLEEPKWGHHTLRRTGDKVARDSMEDTGVTAGDIDDQYGWNQRERSKEQQIHYAGRRDRSRRARVTMML